MAVGVAGLAFSGVGASANHRISAAAGRTSPPGHLAAPLHGGPTSHAVTTNVLQERKRALSRDSQRQATTAASQRRDPATREHGKAPNRAAAKRAARRRARVRAENAWRLPVTKGVYHLTARFGACSGLWAHCHTGLDFAAPTGTPIHAVAGGTIVRTEWAGAYGNRTVERLSDGTVLWYAHQSAFGVKPRQKVVAGQEIGRVGSTGNATGPHVHLEVRPHPDDPVDPYRALIAHGLHP